MEPDHRRDHPAGPVLVRWPGPCWVLLGVDAEGAVHETHHLDRAGAQADLDDRLVELLVEDLDDALAQLDRVDRPGPVGGRRLVDVVTDVPRRGQDAASRLGPSAIYQRPGCCWGLLCGRCGRVRELPGPEDPDGAGWKHLDDQGAACAAAVELGAVCADCAAAAALGSLAGPDGALLPDPPTCPAPPTSPTTSVTTSLTTSLASSASWPAWASARLF